MREFRPRALFYDALSGKFTPETDKQERRHTLARLAVATCEKGELHEGGLLYHPSWARGTYSQLWQGPAPAEGMFDTQLMIADGYGRWPREIRFSDFSRSLSSENPSHELVIHGNSGLEVIRPLVLGPQLDSIRREVAEIAEDYYANVNLPRRLQ